MSSLCAWPASYSLTGTEVTCGFLWSEKFSSSSRSKYSLGWSYKLNSIPGAFRRNDCLLLDFSCVLWLRQHHQHLLFHCSFTQADWRIFHILLRVQWTHTFTLDHLEAALALFIGSRIRTKLDQRNPTRKVKIKRLCKNKEQDSGRKIEF